LVRVHRLSLSLFGSGGFRGYSSQPPIKYFLKSSKTSCAIGARLAAISVEDVEARVRSAGTRKTRPSASWQLCSDCERANRASSFARGARDRPAEIRAGRILVADCARRPKSVVQKLPLSAMGQSVTRAIGTTGAGRWRTRSFGRPKCRRGQLLPHKHGAAHTCARPDPSAGGASNRPPPATSA
jgi:hypothetical protein